MSRSQKLRKEWIPKAKAAVKRSGSLNQQHLSEELGIARSTLSKFLNGMPVDGALFGEICDKLCLDKDKVADLDFEAESENIDNKRQDWGEAKDVSIFYGRTKELAKLEKWVIQERCRLIIISGMGGMGKTTLTVKLAKQIQGEFEYIIWRSLRNAPPIKDLLADLINFVSQGQKQLCGENIDAGVSLLINCLQNARCLLVLDNVESILGTNERAGAYRQGYEGYGQLLRCVGEDEHQSCLILTSREMPRGLSNKVSVHSGIRSFALTGLEPEASQEIIIEKGFSISPLELKALVEHYAGNPLALNIVATNILELFDCNTTLFLEQRTFSFGDISDLLAQQFRRLSVKEKLVMYWLAVNREWVSISELQEDIVPSISKKKLYETINSLQIRSLIEQNSAKFSQQPVVMEYVIDSLLEQVCQEVSTGEINLFNCCAMMKAHSKDYLRQSQINLIIQPLIDRLLETFGSKEELEQGLKSIISNLQRQPKKPGYAGGNIINLLWQLQVDISDYDFSNLYIWQAYLQGASLHRVNFSNSDLSKSIFTQNNGGILSAAFSPNGKLLATGLDSETCIWEVASNRKLISCKGHTAWVVSVAFSPDGQIIATGSNDHTIRLWNANTGQCLKTLRGHTNCVERVAFHPNGQIIASGGNDNTIRLWNVSNGQCVKIIDEHTDRLLFVAFSQDGQILVSSAEDHTTKVWDINSGECLRSLQINVNWILSIALSPDGKTLATGSDGNQVKLWDIQTGECLLTLPDYSNFVRAVDFDASGRLLATADENKNVKVWNVATGECLQTLQEHTQRVWLVAFSPDGETILSVSDDQTAKFWNFQTGKSLRTLEAYSNWVSSVALSHDDKLLASTYEDGLVRVWDISTGKLTKILHGHTDIVSAAAFAPQIKKNSNTNILIATGSDDHTIKLWDTKDGECLSTFSGHDGWVQAVSWSPDGQILASCSHDLTVKLWDCSTGECLHTLQGHTGWVKSVAFCSKELILASSSDDQTIKIWDALTGNCLKTLVGHQDKVVSVAFSPCDNIIASAGADQTIKLWDALSGECLNTLCGHTHRVRSIAISPNGRFLVSGSDDRTVKVWDINTGATLKTFTGHEKVVWCVAFSANGSIIASGSQDETIRLWNFDGDELQVLRAPRPYEGMNITGIIGLTAATKATLKALGAIID